MKLRPVFALILVPILLSGCGKDKDDAAAPTKEVATISQTPLPAFPDWFQAFSSKTVDMNAKLDVGCKGAFDVVKVRHGGAHPGVEVEGWSWLDAQKQPAAHVVFADRKGALRGAGETRVERPDVREALPDVTVTKVGWHGSIGAESGVFTAFAVKPDGSLCRLASKDIGPDAS